MSQFFQKSIDLKPLEQLEILDIASSASEIAYLGVGRRFYLPVDDTDIKDWLVATQVDRYIWREAQPVTATPEFVCVSFSALLWALVEQERLKNGLLYPLAFARLTLLTHSLCGYINQDSQFKLVEPQDDSILTMAELQLRFPDQQIQAMMFI